MLSGFITDGDIRRALLKDESALQLKASDIMTRQPRTISPNRLAAGRPQADGYCRQTDWRNPDWMKMADR